MDYATAVVEFFVERRGKGSALSSADEQTLLGWEAAGIPLSVVFAGVDAAFERKAEPPTSLGECNRWVKAGFKKWSGGALLEPARHSGASEPGTEAGTTRADAPGAGGERIADGEQGGGGEATAVLERLLDELDLRARTGHAALREATADVCLELSELSAAGGLELGLLAVVDEAIAESALARLAEDEREAVVRAAEARLAARSMSGAAWAAARAREIIETLR